MCKVFVFILFYFTLFEFDVIKNYMFILKVKLNYKANGLKVSTVIPLFFRIERHVHERWALNRESTLIGGGRGQIVCDGRFFSILFFLRGLG